MTERPLDPSPLSWTALLGHWVEFAQASVVLPDEDGEAWHASVAPIIQLQALTFALGELDRLAAADRPFARDRATVLIREAAEDLEHAWARTPLPEGIVELLVDARRALERSGFAGATELVWPGPEVLIMPEVPLADSSCDSLAVMQPGTIVMPGEPVAWWIGSPPPLVIERTVHAAPPVPRQVYRTIDGDGRIVEDIVLEVTDDPVPGLPLIVPLVHGGAPIGSFTMDAHDWRAMQERALPESGRIPVRSV